MSMNHADEQNGTFAPLPRPQYQLRSLPIAMRWEVTRRHPAYQIFWNDVSAVPSDCDSEVELRKRLSDASHAILAMIGVNRPTIPPKVEFLDIENDAFPEWMAGSVHPISFRGLVSLILAHLTPESLASISELFLTASDNSDEARVEMLLKLSSLSQSDLDEYPDELIVSLSPTASVRQSTTDLGVVLSQFQEKRGIAPKRNRLDSYDAYLKVWDLREGWSAGEYHFDHEQTLHEIAKQLSLSISTVSNHYRGAFKLITGHVYSPTLWFRVFGPVKFFNQERIGAVLNRRPRKSPTVHDVPDSLVSRQDSSLVEDLSVQEDNVLLRDLLCDVYESFSLGLSDSETTKRILNSYEDQVSSVKIEENVINELIKVVREGWGDRPTT